MAMTLRRTDEETALLREQAERVRLAAHRVASEHSEISSG
jgi:hypothetical protein